MDTKIIATIGPKSENHAILKSMILSGLDMVRINFSHASYDQYYRVKGTLDIIKEETGIDVKILFDLQGPRIRVGKLNHDVLMNDGDVYSFLFQKGDIDNMEIPIDDAELIQDLKIDDPIFLDNGSIELKVIELDLLNQKFLAKVERGGLLLPRKGLNVPKTVLKRPILTAKDLLDIEFAKKVKPEYIAISFVQNSQDVVELKKILNNDDIKIVSKIERAVALDDIDNIIRKSDCIMIARGDLGIEMPMEDLPIIQKNLIRHAHWHNKPAIVATQMMASMIDHYRPTRAEVSDVANAIFDGSDALMLSDETAAGAYPIDAIKIMSKIINKTNEYFNNRNYFNDSDVIYKK
ncbi:pyruvate kinase [Candidatus Falkowbacteria bacterium HGW-Falkowbacteria-1]|uniref:Pyruvate kinase n=1 Tax=Candidatus Falkowbacteria bacterium HGW-Falkowbacteria-1 TaxID=2013768 RepID=A0A2N2EA96_9BACT|nr:MAG: pyruvate kinase [Candidatus Falkowbacteria bacterium HGW-Falkowbacteria-1]